VARQGGGPFDLPDHRLRPRRRVRRPTRRRSPRRLLPTRGELARTHHHPVAGSDHSLAPRPSHQRAHPSTNNPIQQIQRIGFPVPPVQQLPHPGPALRRQTQLGPTPHCHTPLKSNEPFSNVGHMTLDHSRPPSGGALSGSGREVSPEPLHRMAFGLVETRPLVNVMMAVAL